MNLKPGDCLLYKPKKSSLFGWLIAIKTWHAISHCEVYIGDGLSAASRDRIGVDIYPTRYSELTMVLRPKPEYHFNLAMALKWFILSAKGQKYDWLGLLRFTWRSDYSKGNTNNKQFCSEFVLRFYRAGNFDPMPGEDADAVAPFQFGYNPLFSKIEISDLD